MCVAGPVYIEAGPSLLDGLNPSKLARCPRKSSWTRTRGPLGPGGPFLSPLDFPPSASLRV
eukprot:7903353-Pyramimonas_sp.AAC.1